MAAAIERRSSLRTTERPGNGQRTDIIIAKSAPAYESKYLTNVTFKLTCLVSSCLILSCLVLSKLMSSRHIARFLNSLETRQDI